ncbi:Protein of unknown function [Leuconostoc citreum]|nr:Protein of unknown function [Leuconostoc citreum]
MDSLLKLIHLIVLFHFAGLQYFALWQYEHLILHAVYNYKGND